MDTTLLVDLLRSKPEPRRQALAKIKELANRGERIVTTRINLAELYVGIEISGDIERGYQRVRDILDHVDAVLEFDNFAAQVFGEVIAHLRRLGRPTGDMDVLIAAIVLANGHCLVTQNASHFVDIPHFLVETY